MTDNKDLFDNNLRSHKVDKEAQAKAQAAKDKEIRDDLAFVFGTEQGVRALRLIMNLCGYRQSKVGGNPSLGMDVLTGTLYNASREGIYLELRRLLPNRILVKAEAEPVEEIE